MCFIKKFYRKNKFVTIAITAFLIILFFSNIIRIVVENVESTKGQIIYEEVGEHPEVVKKIGEVYINGTCAFEALESIDYGNAEYCRAIVKGKNNKYAGVEFWFTKTDSIWILDSVHVIEVSDTFRIL